MKFNILAILFSCCMYAATAQVTVYDINKTAASSNPYSLTSFNDKLYFMATDITHGHELWGIDSTSGEFMVTDINPGSANAAPNYLYAGMKDRFAVSYVTELQKDVLFFTADDGVHGNELYMYDGNNPPSIAKEIVPGSQGLNDILSMAAGDGYIFFYENSRGIWVYNVDTRDVKILPATVSLGQLKELVYHNGSLYTVVYRPGSSPSTFCLWHYNPSNGDSGVVQTGLQHIAVVTPLGNKLYYITSDNLYAYETNKSLKTIASINGTLTYKPLGIFKNKLYFTGDNYDVFEYDPATDKKKIVLRFNDYWDFNETINFTEHDGKMYFAATDSLHGEELWVWDGVNPPMLAADINAGPIGSRPYSFRSQKDGLYFITQGSEQGREVHRYKPFPATVQNLSFKGEVRAYPNPVTFPATLELQLYTAQTLSVELYNTEGKRIMASPQVLYSQGTSRVELDMRHLPAGNYFYHVRNRDNKSMVSGKLVKI